MMIRISSQIQPQQVSIVSFFLAGTGNFFQSTSGFVSCLDYILLR
jgi:S-adenosylmethionine hydrolase